MADQPSQTQTTLGLSTGQPASGPANGPASHLRQEFESWQSQFDAQPTVIQRFIEAQAGQLANALTQRAAQVRFTLPDRVLGPDGQLTPVPPEFREQMAGGLVDRLARSEASAILRQRLAELEQSPNRALALSAGLLRHAIAHHMIYGMLPSGRSVTYLPAEGEEIPTIPVGDDLEPGSAITLASDAIAEEGAATGADESGRGELQVPYVPAARKFYMPQWVAFGDNDALLVNSANEAEAHIGSMQRFLAVLHMAVSLAPYIVVDETYQQKRYGLLGQLINQGRALARYQTAEIVRAIKQRAAAQDLNRGLSLSLPYFDDQALQMKSHNFEVIPAGRIMFVPAFVVRAAREEQAKVAQDTRLSASTRKHLLGALKTLDAAFDVPAN